MVMVRKGGVKVGMGNWRESFWWLDWRFGGLECRMINGGGLGTSGGGSEDGVEWSEVECGRSALLIRYIGGKY